MNAYTENRSIYKELKTLKGQIPWMTYRTIVGQIKAGDTAGASVGIERLKRKLAKEAARHV